MSLDAPDRHKPTPEDLARARSRRTLRRRKNRKKAKAIRASEQTHPHHLALGWGERASEE